MDSIFINVTSALFCTLIVWIVTSTVRQMNINRKLSKDLNNAFKKIRELEQCKNN